MIYKAMPEYTRIIFTEYITGIKLEVLLLFVPSVLSMMSGTGMIVVIGIGMSIALSASELFYSFMHRRFPSSERLYVYKYKRAYKKKYSKPVSVRKAVKYCKRRTDELAY